MNMTCISKIYQIFKPNMNMYKHEQKFEYNSHHGPWVLFVLRIKYSCLDVLVGDI